MLSVDTSNLSHLYTIARLSPNKTEGDWNAFPMTMYISIFGYKDTPHLFRPSTSIPGSCHLDDIYACATEPSNGKQVPVKW